MSEQTFDEFTFIKTLYECEKYYYILREREEYLQKKIETEENDFNNIYSLQSNFKKSNFYEKYSKNYKYKKDYPPVVDKPREEDSGDGCLVKIMFLPLASDLLLIFGCLTGNLKSSILTFLIIVGIIFAMIEISLIASIKNEKRQREEHFEEYYQYYSERKKIEEENKQAKIYNNQIYNYWLNEFRKSEAIRIKKSKEIIEKELDEISDKRSEVAHVLYSLYELRVDGILCLHPDYQGIVPISVIYGYFDTGRCTSLRGRDGAYNLYEDEKFKRGVSEKLDTIIDKLDDLGSGMEYAKNTLYECRYKLDELKEQGNDTIKKITTMNSNVKREFSGISDKLSNIDYNEKNNSYYSEISAKMSTFNALYNYFSD